MSLRDVLQGCLSGDASVRQQAEAALEQLKGADGALLALTRELSEADDEYVRHMASLVLRRWVAPLWGKQPAEQCGKIREALQDRLKNERSEVVRRALVDTVAAAAKRDLPTNSWPTLLPFLNECAHSADPSHRVAAMALFAALAESAPAPLSPHFASLHAVFLRGLQDTSKDVQLSSLDACTALIGMAVQDGSNTAALQQIMEPALCIIEAAAATGDTAALTKGVTVLLEAIEASQPLLQHCLLRVVAVAGRAAANAQLDLAARGHCSQVLNWLAAYKPRQLARASCVPEIVAQLCKLTTEAPEKDHDPEMDPPSAREFSCYALDTLALSLPSKHVWPGVSQFLEGAAGAADPAARCGALAAAAAVIEGSADALRKRGAAGYARVRDVALGALRDNDAEVRRAAAVALAHLSMHVQPQAGEDCDALLPPLLAALAAEPPGGERTRETLVHAVDGVLTHLPEGSIQPYLPPLMAALAALLDTAPPAMHDTLLSCATSAAAAAEDAAFAPYATQLLTRLQPYVEATAKPARSARAAAMDCAGHVAARLEPTAARELLPRFFRAAVGGFELGDPLLREYGYALLAMGAQVLGRDFAPWLEGSAQLAFESLDAVDGAFAGEGADSDDLDEDNEVPEVGQDRSIKVRTGVADEKAAALAALGSFGRHCGDLFAAFIEATAERCQACLDSFHDDVRSQAARALPACVAAAHAAQPPPEGRPLSEAAQTVCTDATSALLITAGTDPERQVVASCFAALTEVCEIVPEGALAPELGAQAAAIIVDVLKGSADCQQGSGGGGGGSEDGDALAAEIEDEEALLEAACDAVPALAVVMSPVGILPLWKEHVAEAMLSRLRPSEPDFVRSTALGALAELTAVLGAEMGPWVERLAAAAAAEMRCAMPQNRHHGVFLLGILVAQCSEAFAGEAERTLALIEPLLSDAAPTVVDNACGALGRLAAAHAEKLPLNKVAAALARLVPLRADFEEAEPVYAAIRGLVLGPHCEAVAAQRQVLVKALAGGALLAKVPDDVRRGAAAGVREAVARWRELEAAVLVGLSESDKQTLQQLAA